MTRWHEDDLVGRLTDPTNPHYNAEEAAQWKIINIPAIAGMMTFWAASRRGAVAERFGLPYLESFRAAIRSASPRSTSSSRRRRTATFSRRNICRPIGQQELPKNLRVYAASDHAVGIKQTNDRTCLLIVGVDDHDEHLAARLLVEARQGRRNR
jgi:hypothetical protein